MWHIVYLVCISHWIRSIGERGWHWSHFRFTSNMIFFFSEITNGIPEGLQTLSTEETGRQTECSMNLWHCSFVWQTIQCLGKVCSCSCLPKGPLSEVEFNGSPDENRKHRWQRYGSAQVVGPAWEHVTPTVSQGLVVQKRANAAHLEEKKKWRGPSAS